MLDFLRRNMYTLSIVLISILVFTLWYSVLYNINTRALQAYNFSNIKTDEDFKNFFSQFGVTVSEKPIEVLEFALPDKMDDVYRRYNALQKKAGLDLTPYLGRTVMRHTYKVLSPNFNTTDEVRANVLVYNDRVIAGDIMTVSFNGFMYSLLGK